MALRKIFKEGEPILQKKAKPVVKYDGRLSVLIDDMRETLKDANGVGLAAPQVGVLRRIIVIDAGEETGIVELINPDIIEKTGAQVYYEGCLSYPGFYGNVGRPEEVTVRANDRKGDMAVYRATGLYAVACSHEIDHLAGEMFMRKVRGKLYTLDEIKKMREENAAQAGSETATADGTRESGADSVARKPDADSGSREPDGDSVARVPGRAGGTRESGSRRPDDDGRRQGEGVMIRII